MVTEMIDPAMAALKGRHFLTLADYTSEELETILSVAREMKKGQKEGKAYQPLHGKTLGMIFTKASTRTRVSFEVGMFQLGGYALFLSKHDSQLGRGEPIADTARVMSRYVDGIMIRTFAHRDVVELARFSGVPVINGLTDSFHPCQAMADMLTLAEHFGELKGRKLAFIGDGNNMVHSLMIAGVKLGLHVAVATPKGYEPQQEVIRDSTTFAAENGGALTVTNDPMEAAEGADVVYTDVWASMGQEEEALERKKAFQAFTVNNGIMAQAKKAAIFLHCLPAHRGEEVAADVIDGPQSLVFDQAENRLHVQKAILSCLM